MTDGPGRPQGMPLTMQRLQGLGVAEGIAIGRAVCIETRAHDVYRFPLDEGQVDQELARFRHATERALEEIEELRTRVGSDLGQELAGIFEVHGMLLRDRFLLEGIEERIRGEHVNAEWAVWETAAELRGRFAVLQQDSARDHTADVQDVARHLIRALQGISHHEAGGRIVAKASGRKPAEEQRDKLRAERELAV